MTTYAVIFSSRLSETSDGYEETSDAMVEMCRNQPGFVSIESVRDSEGHGITVCKWDSLEAIAAWRGNAEHAEAQLLGISRWYADYDISVCEVLDPG